MERRPPRVRLSAFPHFGRSNKHEAHIMDLGSDGGRGDRDGGVW
jgi:hypothetical protein